GGSSVGGSSAGGSSTGGSSAGGSSTGGSSGAAAIVISNSRPPSAPLSSVTATVKANVLSASGMPAMVPDAGSMVSPSGSVPSVIDQVTAPIVSTASSVAS